MSDDLPCYIVYTTVDTRERADAMAAMMVNEGIAACVQVLDVQSVYRWKGKVETAAEFRLEAKTTTARVGTLMDFIRNAHPYETPEIIAVPIMMGDERYLAWMKTETQHGGRMKKIMLVMAISGLWLAGLSNVNAHCEIPCGIYDDQARLNMILEHVTTIEKSMAQIDALSADAGKNSNQLIRWVTNKETHAEALQEIVTQYFMTQRIKAPAADDETALKKYNAELGMLHQMLVHAMKAKQTTDITQVEALRSLLHDFGHSYLGVHTEGK